MISVRAHHSGARAKRVVCVVALLGTSALPLALSSCGADGYLGDLFSDAAAPNDPDTSIRDAASDVSTDDAFVSPDASATCPAPTATAPPGSAHWARLAGYPVNKTDVQRHSGLAVDSNGNVAVIGYFTGSINLGGDTLVSPGVAYDVYVAKYDSKGNHLWSKRFGDTGNHQGVGIAFDSAGNVYVTGAFTTTINFSDDPANALTTPGNFRAFLAKLDPNGNHLWSRSYGSSGSGQIPPSASGTGVDVDPQDNVIVSGDFNDAIDFAGQGDAGPGYHYGAGQENPFIVKLTANGTYVWSRAFSMQPNGSSHVFDQAVDSVGGAVIVGYFMGTMSLSGGGSLVAFGCATASGCNLDGFVIKVDTNGNSVFARVTDGPWPNEPLNVAVDPKGDVAVSGQFLGPLGLANVGDPNAAGPWDGGGPAFTFLAKLDGKSGVRKWGYATGPTHSGLYTGYVAADSLGNLYLASGFGGTLAFPGAPSAMTSAGSDDAYVVKVDNDGKYLWSRPYGGSNWEESTGIAVDRCGTDLVVSGTVRSVVTFERADDGGLITLDGTGAVDAGGSSYNLFVARLAPNGTSP